MNYLYKQHKHNERSEIMFGMLDIKMCWLNHPPVSDIVLVFIAYLHKSHHLMRFFGGVKHLDPVKSFFPIKS